MLLRMIVALGLSAFALSLGGCVVERDHGYHHGWYHDHYHDHDRWRDHDRR
jgi:hypothetical protein